MMIKGGRGVKITENLLTSYVNDPLTVELILKLVRISLTYKTGNIQF